MTALLTGAAGTLNATFGVARLFGWLRMLGQFCADDGVWLGSGTSGEAIEF